jgi:hypothetical protein
MNSIFDGPILPRSVPPLLSAADMTLQADSAERNASSRGEVNDTSQAFEELYARKMMDLAEKEGRLRLKGHANRLPNGHITNAIKSALADGPKMAAEIMDSHPEICRRSLGSTLGAMVRRGKVEQSGPKRMMVYSLKAEQTTAERLRDAIQEAEA